MKFPRFKLVAAISIVVIVVVSIIWWRSYQISDLSVLTLRARWNDQRYLMFTLGNGGGGLRYNSGYYPELSAADMPGVPRFKHNTFHCSCDVSWTVNQTDRWMELRRGGFQYEQWHYVDRAGHIFSDSGVIAPLWFWCAVGSLWPLLWAYRKWRRRHRRRVGHCPNCAYNLTGNSSGKCPECGTVVELAAVNR